MGAILPAPPSDAFSGPPSGACGSGPGRNRVSYTEDDRGVKKKRNASRLQDYRRRCVTSDLCRASATAVVSLYDKNKRPHGQSHGCKPSGKKKGIAEGVRDFLVKAHFLDQNDLG